MGGMKDLMIEHQENLAAAASYLVTKGHLDHCEYHGEIFGGGWTLDDDFWRSVMADRKRGNNGPIPWAASMEAREFTDLIKRAYEDHAGDGCGYCAKNLRD